MRKFYTQIQAVDPYDGKIKTYDGPYIEAPNRELAQQYCDTHELGYCFVTSDWVIEEIEVDTGQVTKFENNN